MSAHILLNLLNEFGKRDKMQGLSSILSLFCNEFYSVMQEHEFRFYSSYNIKITLKSNFCCKTL